MKRITLVVAFLFPIQSFAAGPFTRELKQYAHDARVLTLAPLHWDRGQWMRFGEGTAAVLAVYAADRPLDDAVQRNRSAATNNFARIVTPFGAERAIGISALLIAAGSFTNDPRMRDAGRDSLESEVWAAGIVAPVLKRTFGRTRPSQEQGAHSFHPFTSKDESFPSGHATNAFAFASAIAGHYDGWIVPAIVYTMATGVAFSRVNDRAHFPSDVVAGALIGRTVGRSLVSRHRNTRVTLIWTTLPAGSQRTARTK